MQPSEAVDTHLMYLYSVPRVALRGGGTHAARRLASSSSLTFTCTVLCALRASISISSPSWIRAIGPPSCASGTMCPMQKPCVAPENLPSVIRATLCPSPAPIIALVGLSISGIPGPPLGPSYLTTTTVPGTMALRLMASLKSSSQSNTAAVPLNTSPSLPVIFATHPPGATLPYMIWRCPVALMGELTGKITFCPLVSSGKLLRFSPIDLPVTVSCVSSIKPSWARYFMRAGVPPTLCRSSITYLPEGFMSARNGVLSEIFWKSSMVRGTSAARAMAMRCMTALVLPPVAMMMTIALSKEARVMISEGRMFFSRSTRIALPATRHSCLFSLLSAG
mmetsp:Transcript_23696/g.58577  ORF Transcript_23696/g.58577 Transcript_23696/m.58577 type:complete len:336 (-) Transcript_23696:810-1817(-)